MRCWIIGLGCLLCATAAAETFPHKATVVSLNVTARSGESFGTYPTERLAKHSQVEVRQAGASGWVAIAPPNDAFDWLPAAAVKLSEDRKTGEVIVATAPAYIGSNVRKIEEHVSQTDLKRGDTIRVLTVKGNWLKIAPPAGEVRWVQEKHLSTDSPEKLVTAETEERLAREDGYRRENAANPPGLLADLLQGKEVAEARRDESIERAQFLRRNRPALLSRKPRESARKKEDEPAPSVEIDNGKPSEGPDMEVGTDASPRSTPQIVKPTPPPPRTSLDSKTLIKEAAANSSSDKEKLEETRTPASEQPPAKSETQIPPIDSQEFKKRLTQLDVDLTEMVAQDSSQWDLPQLRQRAAELVELGPSPLARGKARLVLDRIAEFASTLPPAETGVLSQTTKPTAAEPAAKQPDFATQYDALGYLMPIVGSRPGLPQYQLTDKDGRSLSLVTARPGINLNAYVKKQVGLYGQRGYVDSLKKPHILAERVVDLEGQRR